MFRSWRGPGCPLNDQLDRLEPLLLLRIVPKTDAQEVLSVLFRQGFGAPLARLQDQSRLHERSIAKSGEASKAEKKGIVGVWSEREGCNSLSTEIKQVR